jgi:hypothetical protein
MSDRLESGTIKAYLEIEQTVVNGLVATFNIAPDFPVAYKGPGPASIDPVFHFIMYNG